MISYYFSSEFLIFILHFIFFYFFIHLRIMDKLAIMIALILHFYKFSDFTWTALLFCLVRIIYNIFPNSLNKFPLLIWSFCFYSIIFQKFWFFYIKIKPLIHRQIIGSHIIFEIYKKFSFLHFLLSHFPKLL